MEDSTPKIVSEFNENSLQVQRLHEIKLRLARLKFNGQLEKAKWELFNYELELAGEIDRMDKNLPTKNKWDTKIKIIDKKINDSFKLKKGIYYALIEKERLLRICQQESGMGTTHKDSDEDDEI